MFKNLTKKQIIIIVVVGVVVIGLIIFLVMRNKKKKKEKEIMDAEIKNFVPEPLSKEDTSNFVPARKSQVIPQEDLKNESSKVVEAIVKPINRPAPAKPQAKQPIPSGKKEVPFTPIMEEDRELVEEMNKADQDKRPGMSIEN